MEVGWGEENAKRLISCALVVVVKSLGGGVDVAICGRWREENRAREFLNKLWPAAKI